MKKFYNFRARTTAFNYFIFHHSSFYLFFHISHHFNYLPLGHLLIRLDVHLKPIYISNKVNLVVQGAFKYMQQTSFSGQKNNKLS